MKNIPVVFRMIEGECIALFPSLNEGFGLIQSYMHVGQHSPAARDLIDVLPIAASVQYTALANELVSIGYDNLDFYSVLPSYQLELTND
jgi:hypothetical protein